MIKSQKTAQKGGFLAAENKTGLVDKEKVSTPQFQGEIMRDNRFSSFRQYPQQEVVSRIS